MRTEHLRYFQLCYLLQSYTLAAKRIPMSRQGLVKAIKSLEGAYGIALFDSEDGVTLKPTPYADALMEYAQLQEVHEKELQHKIARLKAVEGREVRVGASFGIMGYLGDGFSRLFAKKHPDITLTFVEAVDAECDRMLVDGDVDLALVVAPWPQGCVTTELSRCGVSMWVNSANPLARKEMLTVQDLNGQNVAVCGKGFKCYDALLAQCEAQHVRVKGLFETAELFRIYEYVAQNKGVGYIPNEVCNMWGFRGSEQVVRIALEGFEWRCGVSHVMHRRLLEQEENVADFLVSYMKEHPME